MNGTLSSEEDNSADREREIARRNARDEQLRIQEQYQRLIQRQAEMVLFSFNSHMTYHVASYKIT